MEKYRTLKQKHAVLKEAYLQLEENVKILTNESEAKQASYDSKLFKLNTDLTDRNNQIKSLRDELINLTVDNEKLELKLARTIQECELNAASFDKLTDAVCKTSIYDNSIDSLYELSCCSGTAEYINFNSTLQKILALINESMQDNKFDVLIKENVQVKFNKCEMEEVDHGLDNLESLASLNLDLLRFMDKMKFKIQNIVSKLQQSVSLQLTNELVTSIRLYLTIEEYLFADVQNSNNAIIGKCNIISNTTCFIKSLGKLSKFLLDLNNTLSFLHKLITNLDDVKVFTWSRCEKILCKINDEIKNIAKYISHRMCFPKICNGKFLPLTGGTEILMELYELFNSAPAITMNIAIVFSKSEDDFQVSVGGLVGEWANKLNNLLASNKDQTKEINNLTIGDTLRLRELELALAECETQTFIANYQRKSLITYLNNICELVNESDTYCTNYANNESFTSEFDREKFTDSVNLAPKANSICHKIDYLINPLSLSMNNRNYNELAGYVTILVKDGIALAEDNAKMASELSNLRVELERERDSRKAAEESCRASINELTKYMGTMESTIADYENKLSQHKRGI